MMQQNFARLCRDLLQDHVPRSRAVFRHRTVDAPVRTCTGDTHGRVRPPQEAGRMRAEDTKSAAVCPDATETRAWPRQVRRYAADGGASRTASRTSSVSPPCFHAFAQHQRVETRIRVSSLRPAVCVLRVVWILLGNSNYAPGGAHGVDKDPCTCRRCATYVCCIHCTVVVVMRCTRKLAWEVKYPSSG